MKKALIILLAVVALVSCSKKEVKQTTLESTIAKEAFEVAENAKNAYVRKDMSALRLYASEEGLKDIMVFGGTFSDLKISLTPRWVEIEGNRVMVNTSWQSTWTVSGTNSGDRGMAVFVMEGRPLKIVKILRSNPFQYPKP